MFSISSSIRGVILIIIGLSKISSSSSIWIIVALSNNNTKGIFTLNLGTIISYDNIISLISGTSISRYRELIIISSDSKIDISLDSVIVKIENTSINRIIVYLLILTGSISYRNSSSILSLYIN